MIELPEFIYFNPCSITNATPRREGAYQIYARTHGYSGDAKYCLITEGANEDRPYLGGKRRCAGITIKGTHCKMPTSRGKYCGCHRYQHEQQLNSNA